MLVSDIRSLIYTSSRRFAMSSSRDVASQSMSPFVERSNGLASLALASRFVSGDLFIRLYVYASFRPIRQSCLRLFVSVAHSSIHGVTMNLVAERILLTHSEAYIPELGSCLACLFGYGGAKRLQVDGSIRTSFWQATWR